MGKAIGVRGRGDRASLTTQEETGEDETPQRSGSGVDIGALSISGE
jgi:hypothetical protein